MAIPPQYGVGLTADELNTQIPTSVLYGITPANTFIPVKVTADGSLSIGSVTISGPVTIGDVTIQGVDPDNGNTPHDVAVVNFGADGYVLRSALFDGANHLLVNADGSINVNASVTLGGNVGLLNVAAMQINPATQDTLALVLSALTGSLDVALSTRTKPSDTQLVDGSAHPQPVTGTFWQTTQPVSGTIAVSNFPATQPVSGTVLAAQSGTWNIILAAGSNHIGLADQGTPNSLANAWPVKPTDGTNSQTFLVTGEGRVAITQPLPAGSNGIGSVTVSSGSIAVSNLPATQPISAASLPLPAGASTEATLAAVKADLDQLTFASSRLLVDGSGVTQPVSVTNFPVTQPVSGTVAVSNFPATQPISAASLPLPTGAATEATLAAAKIDLDKFTFAATRLIVDSSQVTSPISAASLPLPTGAATETTLAAIKVDADKFTFASTRLLTDGSGVTQPVSGSVSVSNFPSVQPVSQSGTWTVNLATGSIEIGTVDQGTPGTIANSWFVTLTNGTVVLGTPSNPVRTDPTGTTTQPVSGTVAVSNFPATQPVSGTVTANAGTGNFTVVQPTGTNLHMVVDSGTITANIGTTNGLALDATLSNPQGSVTGGTAGTKSQLMGGTFFSALPSLTSGQQSAIQLDSSGRIIIRPLTSADVVSAVQSGTWTVQPGNTANTTPWLATIAQGGNSATVSAAGALKVDGSAVTQPISAASLPLPTGAATSAKQPALGTAGTPSADVISIQGVSGGTAIPVTQTVATSGGATTYRLLSAATTNAQSIKASAGQAYGWVITNTNASPRYVKLYNKASAPTVGTDTPFLTLMIPGSSSGTGEVASFPMGIPFATGIAIAITANAADSDTTAVALNEVIVNFFYK